MAHHADLPPADPALQPLAARSDDSGSERSAEQGLGAGLEEEPSPGGVLGGRHTPPHLSPGSQQRGPRPRLDSPGAPDQVQQQQQNQQQGHKASSVPEFDEAGGMGPSLDAFNCLRTCFAIMHLTSLLPVLCTEDVLTVEQWQVIADSCPGLGNDGGVIKPRAQRAAWKHDPQFMAVEANRGSMRALLLSYLDMKADHAGSEALIGAALRCYAEGAFTSADARSSIPTSFRELVTALGELGVEFEDFVEYPICGCGFIFRCD